MKPLADLISICLVILATSQTPTDKPMGLSSFGWTIGPGESITITVEYNLSPYQRLDAGCEVIFPSQPPYLPQPKKGIPL